MKKYDEKKGDTFKRFEGLAKQLMSVPKKEVDKKEEDYQKNKEKHAKHRD